MSTKLDKRRKYYLVLDCETATLPHAQSYSGRVRKQIAITKPLIYDIGWTIVDRRGHVYKEESFLVTEIFSVPYIFNTAHYASKRPIYLQKLRNHEITLKSWTEIAKILQSDLDKCCAVGAYNSMFDFKKAIPFTQSYIYHLYNEDYFEWEARQNQIIDNIAANCTTSPQENFDKNNFSFLGKSYPLFDIWGLSCRHLLNNDEYRAHCAANSYYSPSRQYYSTTAENAFRFVMKENDFIESHTALEDARIESKLLSKIIARSLKNFEIGIIYFPFREIGKLPISV